MLNETPVSLENQQEHSAVHDWQRNAISLADFQDAAKNNSFKRHDSSWTDSFPASSDLLSGLTHSQGNTDSADISAQGEKQRAEPDLLNEMRKEIVALEQMLKKIMATLEKTQPTPGTKPPHDKPPTEQPPHHTHPTEPPPHHHPPTDQPPHPWNPGFLFGGNSHGTLDSIQQQIGGRANLEMFPVHPGNAEQMQHVRDDLARGVTPEISLNGEFFSHGTRGLASGEYDQQLTQMARELGNMTDQNGNRADMLMRIMKEPEMMHNFMGTGPDVGRNYVAAFQHIADIFHREAPNVHIAWCPTKQTDPSGLGAQADPSRFWPGSNAVDVIGPDGYSPTTRERSFQEIFQPFAQLAQRLNKPFMVSETNIKTSVNDEQSAQWWRDAFSFTSQLRHQGVDVLGVGAFARHEDELLSNAERRALQQTFIPFEGR
ncbi:MAG: hypothetical protein JST01_08025 [Cyanobacteria bacterium SZAS TMP-1]|nr:hypothetical protein [Cyanobacteria bacterium SZAS TMP-1]